MCPYHRAAPRSLEGWQCWSAAIAAAGQLRIAPTGRVLGIDQAAVLAQARAQGADPDAVARLLPALQAGMIDGLADRAAKDDADESTA